MDSRRLPDDGVDGADALTRPRRALRTASMGVALAVLLLVAIFLFCLVVSLICVALVLNGIIPRDFYTNPQSGILGIALLSLSLSMLVSTCINRTLVRPLHRMTAAMDELARGNFDVRLDRRELSPLAEIAAYADSFNRAAAELGGTELMRTSFIGDFSHEFRTPITALNGFAQLLRDPELSAEERAEYVDIIVEESERLAGLSERILTLSRLESQAILPEVGPVDLSEQIRRCALMLEPKWEGKGVRVAVDLDPCTVQGNAGYLAEVWTNLLDNAIKFAPEGSCVSVGLYGGRRGEEGREGACDEAVVWVSDEGPGMDAATRARVFEKFFQGDASHAGAGNGLGLALVKRIVELHGGTVGVESRPGSGTVFEVRLPLA